MKIVDVKLSPVSHVPTRYDHEASQRTTGLSFTTVVTDAGFYESLAQLQPTPARIYYKSRNVRATPGWRLERRRFWMVMRRLHGWLRARAGYEPDVVYEILELDVNWPGVVFDPQPEGR